MEENRSVIDSSYYMIDLFHNEKLEITNLKLQKLMYFSECFYMYIFNKGSMFDDKCYAWTYGPVYPNLYRRFKEFSKSDILLNDDNIAIGRDICEDYKMIMQAIFMKFGKEDTSYLVALTHENGSPWYNVYKNKSQNEIIKMDIPISKIESVEWFKKKFIVEGINDER